MYIIITEFGDMFYSNAISNEELSACEDGYLDLINISNERPKQYVDGEWRELKKWDS